MPITSGYPQSGAVALQQPGQAGAQDPYAQMAANRKQILANTEGRATQLANDPYQKSAMDYLQGVVGGANKPFTDTVKNSILSQQGQGFADAEAAQMQSLRDSLGASGGSIYDPGYQAAQRQAMSQRQGQNLDASGKLEAQAGIENFNAQMKGATNLSSARNAQNAQQNQMLQAGTQFRQNDVAQVPTAPASGAPGTPGASPTAYNPWALVPPSQRTNTGIMGQNQQALRGMI